MRTVDDIAALRKGDPIAQEHFLRRHAPSLFATILRMVNNVQDAEELTQDTLIKALDNIDRYKPGIASLDTWLTRIAYNTAANHLREAPPPLMFVADVDEQAEAYSDTAMEELFRQSDDDAIQQLSNAIGQLTTIEQTLIALFYYDDRTIQEIAYITGMQPSTIGTRLHRIRRKLYHLITNNHQS